MDKKMGITIVAFVVCALTALTFVRGVGRVAMAPIIESGPAIERVADVIVPVGAEVSQVHDDVVEEAPIPIVFDNRSKLHVCDRSPEPDFSSMLCYTAQPDDTLWNIAERYLGSGFRWTELHDGPPTNGGYRRNQETGEFEHIGYIRLTEPAVQLKPGMEVGMYGFSMLPPELEVEPRRYHVQDSALSPYGDDMLLMINTYKTNEKTVYLNGERYDDAWHGHVSHLRFSPDGEHISYVYQLSWKDCVIVVDKAEHSFDCGNDIQDPMYSPSGAHYIFRVNSHDPSHWTGPDPFAIISDLGNGSYYDYVDQLTWIDDQTFAYRARLGDTWRIVINHQEQDAFKYVDSLKGKNGVVTYSAEHDDGTWTDESIAL